MVAATGTNGHRLASLIPETAPEIATIDGRKCLLVTDQRPLTDLRAFPLSRPVGVPGKPWLCVMVKMRVVEHGGETYVEGNVLSVGFWSAHEADVFWQQQLCLTQAEAEACEETALRMV